MRLWTLHPRYLGDVELIATWDDAREAWRLLSMVPVADYPSAITRWRESAAPRPNLSWFMLMLAREMMRRDFTVPTWPTADGAPAIMTVTAGQVAVERAVLLRTIDERGRPDPWMELAGTVSPDLQPMFKMVPGGPEPWEAAPEASTLKLMGRD